MRILVTGLVAQYAFGGVAWDYLQYVEGFRQLGHDVFYLEDTEMWPYDPVGNTVTADCSYNVAHLRAVMDRLGLADRWIYRNGPDGSYHGLSESETQTLAASTDVFVNVSGCAWMRPEYRSIPCRIFIDSDPLFSQVSLLADTWKRREILGAHTVHCSFGENIGRAGCRVPTGNLTWHPTRQPVVLDWWPVAADPPRSVFTTVMNWVSYQPVVYGGETWGQKDVEFLKFIDLPRRTPHPLEIAMHCGQGLRRPTAQLGAHGWRIIEPAQQLPDPWTYRDYLSSSQGEWSIAKEGYVKSHSGWFSGRSACYLALGRPCILQDTGFSDVLPAGEGVLPFRTIEEAVAGLAAVARDPQRHRRAARALAEQHFDARRVLADLLERSAAHA